MKPKKMLRWVVLASVSTVVAACGGGVSSLGSGDDPSIGKSGSSSMSTGGTKGDPDPGKGGSLSMAGKGSGIAGTGIDPGSELCMSDKDCPDYGAPCEPCADGSYACNKTYCASGKCVHTRDQCSIKCADDKDCPVRDVACKDCGDGTTSCETSQCVMGLCQTSYPGCGGYEPCNGVACGSPCKDCGPDGMGCTDALTYCDAGGKCVAGIPQCVNTGQCKTAMDCGSAPPDCKPCGNDTCAQFQCLENKCVFGCLPNPEPQCKVSEDCPNLDICKTCPTTMQCAVQACLQGSCEFVCPVE
jgi:hypothetical protein